MKECKTTTSNFANQEHVQKEGLDDMFHRSKDFFPFSKGLF
jgi:hypothetical protein